MIGLDTIRMDTIGLDEVEQGGGEFASEKKGQTFVLCWK
jgi:hypothetical protein